MTLPGGGVWTYGYGPSPGNSTALSLLPKDDPNSVSQMLSRITDDQGRAVDTWLDESGRPYQVRSNQVFDANQNAVSYQQTVYTYDNNTSNNPSAWLTRLANTWNFKDGQGQWQQSTLVQNDYTMDNSGQRLTNQITSADGTNRTEQYGYDELNRLKTVDYGDGQTQSYAFDPMGNRTSKLDSSTGTEGYTVNAANMLLTRAGNNYANDLDGNTLTGGGRTNTWDSQNRLVTCVNGGNTSSFVYGADGLRRQSTVNGTSTDFVLDNSMFVRERNHVAGNNIATYLVGVRGPEYRRDDIGGTVRWYLYDGLGSVLGEVDPNGTVTSSRKYDVYGAVRGGVNPSGTSKHKFVGQLGHPSEDETGFVYARARFYDPVVGRFASEDPQRQGKNWYIYCLCDPVNIVDESGTDIKTIIRCLGELYMGLVMSDFVLGIFIIFATLLCLPELILLSPLIGVDKASALLAAGLYVGIEKASDGLKHSMKFRGIGGPIGEIIGFALAYDAMLELLIILYDKVDNGRDQSPGE